MGAFKAAGGCVLLVYSAFLTRTAAQIAKDKTADMEGGTPLVLGPTNVCSMQLMALLMKGEARGSIAAFSTLSKERVDWPPALGVGMLSLAELESGVPTCDALKTPSCAVWVLHGGDHFTTLFDPTGKAAAAREGDALELWHWNGLPPAGPRMARVNLKAVGGVAPASPAKHEEDFVAPVPGQIEGVVQCHAEDKKARPNGWCTWRYEVVLAVPDPDFELYGKGRERRDDEPPPRTYAPGELPAETEAWRCANCYRGRFKTMCFGQNDAGSVVCRHCDKPIKEAGWSQWMSYDELTPGWQSTVTARHAPKVISLLRTKWPACELTFGEKGDEPAPSV